jgi:hypothetical protein
MKLFALVGITLIFPATVAYSQTPASAYANAAYSDCDQMQLLRPDPQEAQVFAPPFVAWVTSSTDLSSVTAYATSETASVGGTFTLMVDDCGIGGNLPQITGGSGYGYGSQSGGYYSASLDGYLIFWTDKPVDPLSPISIPYRVVTNDTITDSNPYSYRNSGYYGYRALYLSGGLQPEHEWNYGSGQEPFALGYSSVDGVISLTSDFEIRSFRLEAHLEAPNVYVHPWAPATATTRFQFVLGPLPEGVECQSYSGVFPGCDVPAPLQAAVLNSGSTEPFANVLAGPVSDPIGVLGECSGTITITRGDGTVGQVTDCSDVQLALGDTIETGPDGAVELIFDDDTSFAIDSDARIVIDEYVYDPLSEGSESRINILRSIFVWTSNLVGGDDEPEVTLDTPHGSIGIRGDASDYIDDLDVSVRMNVGSPIHLETLVPPPTSPTTLTFEYVFLTAGPAALEVYLGNALLATLPVDASLVNVLQRAEVAVPASASSVPLRLSFRFDGTSGSQLLIDEIEFPGLANGGFDRFDYGWFSAGPGHLDLVATISESRYQEILQTFDQTPPSATVALSSAPNGFGWHNSDVTVTFTCDDVDSGVKLCPDAVLVSSEGEAQAIGGTATDYAGNSTDVHAQVSLDKTPPIMSCAAVPVFTVNEPLALVSASVGDSLSGAVTPTVSQSVPTGQAGTFSVTLAGQDRAGNSTEIDCDYRVENAALSPRRISGSGYNMPETPVYRASFSVDVAELPSDTDFLKYYYTRSRMSFVSTGITGVAVSGTAATVSGEGTVNGAAGYTFIATLSDSSPDAFGIEIRRPDGALHFSAPARGLAGGTLTMTTP